MLALTEECVTARAYSSVPWMDVFTPQLDDMLFLLSPPPPPSRGTSSNCCNFSLKIDRSTELQQLLLAARGGGGGQITKYNVS